MANALQLADKTFGDVTVLKRIANNKHNRSQWLCRCVCGKKWAVEGAALAIGDVVSCGCQRSIRLRRITTTHGLSGTPEYRIWTNIKTRCYNKNRKVYRYYGGRGIKMCLRWKKSFEAFLADMGKRPSDQHQIDRIDNNGHYEPGNCRWAARQQQMANMSSNRHITYRGATRTVSEWARLTHIDRHTISKRVKDGLPLAEVFRQSPRRWRKHERTLS